MAEKKFIREFRNHQLGGMPPLGFKTWREFGASIPLYPGVDREGLYELEKEGSEPFNVVLDVFVYNVTSENGLVYDEEFVNTLLEQLPGKGGIFGHVKAWDADTAFPIEAADWIGHIRVGDTIYAKAYIPPGENRNFVHRIVKRGGQIRTSLQGAGVEIPVLAETGEPTGQYRLKDFSLSRLDFAPAEGSALRNHQSGVPIITSETIRPTQDNAMTAITITDVPASVKEQIIKEAQLVSDVKRVAELETKLTELQQARETAAAETKKLMDSAIEKDRRIAELTAVNESALKQIAEHRETEFKALVETTIAAYTENWHVTSEAAKQKVEALHNLMRAPLLMMPADARTAEQVKIFARQLWEQQFQPIAESVQRDLAGPGALVMPKHNAVGQQSNNRIDLESGDALKRFKQDWGIN